MGVEWSHESYGTVSGIVRMRKLPINMKWLLISRNRGVHETSVSCVALTRDKYRSWLGGTSEAYC